MIATRANTNLVVQHLIDQSMFVVNALRPAAGEIPFEWFWLSHASKRIIGSFLNEADDSQRFLSIVLNPPRQVFKPDRIKFQAPPGLFQKECLPCDFLL